MPGGDTPWHAAVVAVLAGPVPRLLRGGARFRLVRGGLSAARAPGSPGRRGGGGEAPLPRDDRRDGVGGALAGPRVRRRRGDRDPRRAGRLFDDARVRLP